MLQYNINTSGALSVLIRCTTPDYNETQVTECGINGKWNGDIENICRSHTAIQTQAGMNITHINVIKFSWLHSTDLHSMEFHTLLMAELTTSTQSIVSSDTSFINR